MQLYPTFSPCEFSGMSETVADRGCESLTITARADGITRLNEWFDRVGPSLNIAKTLLTDLKLCVNETVANILTHGDRPSSGIEIRLWRGEADACAEVVDAGAPFDPTLAETSPAAADLEDETIGGWGIQLMREFSDRFSYHRRGGCNHSIFVKRLPG